MTSVPSKLTSCAIVTLLVVAMPCVSSAQAPPFMTYQGRLLTNDGSSTPVNGSVTITFKLFATDVGGTALWQETSPAVDVTDGVFSVLLGTVVALPASAFADPTRYLELTINGEIATPRQRLASVPFAMIDEPGNEVQDLALSGNTLSLTDDASSIDLAGYLDNTDAQNLSLTGDTLSLSGDPSSVDLSAYRDAKAGLGLRYCIATSGVFPSHPKGTTSHDPYLGEVWLFAGNFCPTGTAECDGQSLSIAANSALYTLLGTMYGGDGVTTFNLPDLRARVPLGAGNGVTQGGVY